MSDPKAHRPEPARETAYMPPAITWEDELPQGAGLFAGCDKIEGGGDPCTAFPAS